MILILLGLYLFAAVGWFFARDHLPPGGVGLAVKAAFWLVPALVYARARLREGPVAAFALGPPAAGGVARALLVGAAYLGAVIALGALLGQPLELARPPLAALALLVLNATLEEASFRGFLLLHLARKMPFWQANLIMGVAFVLVHVPTFLAAGFGALFLTMCASLFLLALALGEATRATRSIWIAVAVHAVNNLLAG